MDRTIRSTVESLWHELVDSRFDDEAFVRGLLLDLGHDASGQSYSDFLNVLHESSSATNEEMVWCCNEALAFYTSHPLGAAEYLRSFYRHLRR